MSGRFLQERAGVVLHEAVEKWQGAYKFLLYSVNKAFHPWRRKPEVGQFVHYLSVEKYGRGMGVVCILRCLAYMFWKIHI